jgi:hypothetical protein
MERLIVLVSIIPYIGFEYLKQLERTHVVCFVDPDIVAAKMESGLLTPFDTGTLPSIPVPKSPKERTCAWLNSTHLSRRPPRMPMHPDELRGKPLPYSPPTLRAQQMEEECRFPARQCCVDD